MTFADKILKLRKQSGMSQEELAEKLEVSRQAVSRWEMGTAIPDAPNLLQISRLFGVTVDYLINDEYTSEQDIPIVQQTEAAVREESKKDAVLKILIGLQIFSFAVEGLAIASRVLGYTVPFLVFLFIGITLTLGSIIAFEIIFGKIDRNLCRHCRRKYYRTSIWFFSFFPIVLLFYSFLFDFVPELLLLIAVLIFYTLLCAIVTFCLREH